MGLASCGLRCLNSSALLLLGFSGRLTVLCPEIPLNAKLKNDCDLNQLLMKQVIECYLTDGRN